MSNTILQKRSDVAGAVPSPAALAVGEIAVNTADGKAYTKNAAGEIVELTEASVADGSEIGADHLYLSAQNGLVFVATVDGNLLGLTPSFAYTVTAAGEILATQNGEIIAVVGVD
jgi:hypothetical protein